MISLTYYILPHNNIFLHIYQINLITECFHCLFFVLCFHKLVLYKLWTEFLIDFSFFQYLKICLLYFFGLHSFYKNYAIVVNLILIYVNILLAIFKILFLSLLSRKTLKWFLCIFKICILLCFCGLKMFILFWSSWE